MITMSDHHYYDTVKDLIFDFEKLKLNSPFIHWSCEYSEGEDVRIFCYEKPYLVPKYEIFIDINFNVNLFVFGWLIPNSHKLCSSVQDFSIATFIEKISNLYICPGLNTSNGCISHVIPTRIDYKQNVSIPFSSKTFFRSPKCIILCDENFICYRCDTLQGKINKKLEKPLHPNTPLSSVISDKRIINEVKSIRKENNKLKKLLKQECEMKSKFVNSDLASDFDNIMLQNKEKMSPFMKLFWKEQKKLSKTNTKDNRYHPMIIRFCIQIITSLR